MYKRNLSYLMPVVVMHQVMIKKFIASSQEIPSTIALSCEQRLDLMSRQLQSTFKIIQLAWEGGHCLIISVGMDVVEKSDREVAW